MAAPWGNLPHRSNPDGAFVLTALRQVAARWEYQSETLLNTLNASATAVPTTLTRTAQPAQSYEWGGGHSGVLSFGIVRPQNQTRQPTEHGE